MKDNKKGSALLWAIVVVMILSVTVAAALTISYSYYNRAIQNNNQRQAYLTSKGIVEDIVEKIKAGNTAYTELFTELEPGKSTDLKIHMPAEYKLGTSRGQITVNEPKETRGYITIVVTTEYAGQTDTVKADMRLGKVDGLDSWQLIRYYKGKALSLKKYTNIEKAQTMWEKANRLVEVYDRSSKNKPLVENILKADKECWDRLIKAEPNFNFYGFNNDLVRKYFYYGYYESEMPRFTLDDIGDDVPAEIKESIKKLIENNSKPLLIQPFFPSNSVTEAIIFASNGTNLPSGGGWAGVQLIYNHEDKHWYFLKKGITITQFNNTDAGVLAENSKWRKFADGVLSNPEQATRLE